MNITIYCNKCNNGTALNRLDNTVRNCACDRNPPSSKPSNSNGSLGKRSAAVQTETVEPPKKQTRHSEVVRATVLSMMDNWYIEENNILSETLQEAEDSYDRIVANMRGELLAAQRTAEIRSTQLTQAMRFIAMVHTWCPLVEEMFPGDVDALRFAHAQLDADLHADIIDLTAETDDEDN